MTNRAEAEKILAYGFIGLYLITSIIYGFVDPATWDDDCPTRYYNTVNAFKDPQNFINLWNRPLYVLVYCIPAQLGKYALMVSMVIMTATAGYYLWKGAVKAQVKNTYLILPFYYFQTFFFTVSRNAETEPLAAALICFGYYFLVNKKWIKFAIFGSLIPLARLELSVLLIFWGYELLKNKQYRYIPILAIPLLIWDIAGGISSGNYLFLFSSTFGTEDQANRYGHTSLFHYFQRYIFVIGPVIYILLVTGIIARIKKTDLNGYILIQFLTSFFLYVLFSWKLNMGNAAGFLRNLLPLTPLAALLSLDGYNYITDSFSNTRNISAKTSSVSNQDSASRDYFPEAKSQSLKITDDKLPKKKISIKRIQGEKQHAPRSGRRKTRSNLFNKVVYIYLIFILVAISVYFFHSYKLEIHHKLLKEPDFLNFYIILGVIGFFTIFYLATRMKDARNLISLAYGLAFSLGLCSFTLITEKPGINNSPERQTMKEISDLYVRSYLRDLPTYVNHIWFFWANDMDPKGPNFHPMVLDSLDVAETESLCIWENHYSHRLGGDVDYSTLNGTDEWLELTRRISSDKKFTCLLFKKIDTSNIKGNLKLFDEYLRIMPYDAYAYSARGNYKYRYLKDIKGAIEDYSTSIAMDSTYFLLYFRRGNAYLKLKDWASSIHDFRKCIDLNPEKPENYYSLGAIYFQLAMYDSAIVYYSKTIEINKNNAISFLNRAICHQMLQELDLALDDYSTVLKLDNENITALLNRNKIFYFQKEWDLCYNDINEIIRLQPNVGIHWMTKGVCEYYLSRHEDACNSWKQAKKLGVVNASQYIRSYCK